MILTDVDAAGQLLTMNYRQHVVAADMGRCLDTMCDLMVNLEAGFMLLTNLSGLESMEAACGPHLGAMMDLCNARGVGTVVRVIPDPQKDIGFALISLFHQRRDVLTRTYDNLPEALRSIADRQTPAKVSV